MSFHKLDTRANLHDGYKQAFTAQGLSVLLVQAAGKVYALENKCGHFGWPLSDGALGDTSIRCSQHGVEFDLKTGAVRFVLYQDCDAVRVFPVVVRGDDVGIDIPSS